MLAIRRLIFLAVAVVAIGLVWALGQPDDIAFSAGSKCPRGTEAQNKYFSLYRREAGLVGCRRATGEQFDEALGYLPHTAVLNGPIIARASYACDEDDVCNTFVHAEDVINDPNGGNSEEAGPKPFSKAGSVRVTRDLRLAWIACRLRRVPDLERLPRRRPQCAEPGHSRNIVYAKVSSKASVKVLDRGRRIDPSSLRLSGQRLTWKHSGRRRSFDLSVLPAPVATPDPTTTATPTPTPPPTATAIPTATP